MNTSMYEQMSDEVSKCLMESVWFILSIKLKPITKLLKINEMSLTFHFHDFDISVFLI